MQFQLSGMPLVEATRTDCLGLVDDQMANLKITIDRGPTNLGAETGRIHVGIFHTPNCSPQSLATLMPKSSVERA